MSRTSPDPRARSSAKLRHQGRAVRLELRCAAAGAEVYAAWADPARLGHWFADRAEGASREGGTITWFFDDFGFAIPYHVAEAEPGRSFVLDGEVPGRGPFCLQVSIRPEGGGSRLELVNSGFLEGAAGEEEFQGVLSGWTLALATPKLYLNGYAGRACARVLAMRPARFEPRELARRYQRDAGGLRRWLLAEGEGFGAAGDSLRWSLRAGGALTGEVLALTGAEALLRRPEQDGYLALKSISMPGRAERFVALDFGSWRLRREQAEALRAELAAALNRLAAALEDEAGTAAAAV